MLAKSLNAQWTEGDGPNGEPAINESGQRLICVQVANPDFPTGYLIYVKNTDLDAANMTVALWAQLGKPV